MATNRLQQVMGGALGAVLQNLALALVYFAGAKLGLSLTYVHPSASAVWPPTGIAIASVLLIGPRIWPGLALGALVANLSNVPEWNALSLPAHWAASLGIAAGNTLEALAAGWLVNRFAGGAGAFERPRTIFAFVLGAALAATAISATVGVTSLALAGLARWEESWSVWLTWWLGDMSSALIVAPLLLIWIRQRPEGLGGAATIEAAGLAALVLAVGLLVFGPWREGRAAAVPLTFLCIPPLLWAALRFGLRGTVLAAVGTDAVAMWGTLEGYGPFAQEAPQITLPLLQAFVAVVTLTGLVLASAIRQQRRAEAELAEHRDHLQDLVEHRTRELEASAEQLRTAERMAALGTLAAGLGHDMGNLLLPMRARLDVLASEPLSPAGRQGLDAIAECVEYLGRLTRSLRLLALAPGEPADGESTELRAWWDEASGLVKGVVPPRVGLEVRLSEEPLRVGLSPTALTQIVFNLFQNAADVLHDRPGGRITIVAERAEGGVRLIVSDNGPGMTPEVMRRCFEPFFTTKTRGLSTGLGLSLVHSLVRRAGGSIEIESEPQRGTRFVLMLPAGEAARPSGGPRPGAVVEIADQRMASLARSLLQMVGCEIVEARESASVLVTDAPGGETLDGFMADPHRWAVVLGEAGPAASEHVLRLPARPRPAALREALWGAARGAGGG